MTGTHPLELYRWAVQDPETHAVLLGAIYQRIRRGHRPLVLREDFAGTAADAVAWVARRPDRSAVAIDIEPVMVRWAKERAARLLGERAPSLQFITADATTVCPPNVPAADIIAALNYSPFYFHTWASLVKYLRSAREGLGQNGILVANLFGGRAATSPGAERHRITPLSTSEPSIPPFWYEWEVASYHDETHRIDCRIHFHLDSSDDHPGISLPNAFRYDWRHWSPRELLDACFEAGFTDAAIWRHAIDPDLPTPGVFLGPVRPDSLDALPRWNAYIVAIR
jgi:SAM-dependent methyltransferase